MFDLIFKHNLLVAPLVVTLVWSIIQPSALPANIFTPHLEEIRSSLPPKRMMRLPSKILLSNFPEGNDSKYIVRVSNSTSEPGLIVSLLKCEYQLQSCLVGSFAMTATTSVDAQTEFKQHQAAATPITLANHIQGYLLEGQKQKPASGFSSVMWEQDDQFYKIKFSAQERQNLLYMAHSMAHEQPIHSTTASPDILSSDPFPATAIGKPLPLAEGLTTNAIAPMDLQQPLNSINTDTTGRVTQLPKVHASPNTRTSRDTSDNIDSITPSLESLLQSRQPVLTTANQLRQTEVVTSLRYRQSFPPGTSANIGLTGQPTFGISWGATDDLELTLDVQTIDNSGPIRQGPFRAQRINPDFTGPNFFQEFALQLEQRLWHNEAGTEALSGVVAATLGNGKRPFRFFDVNGPISNGKNSEVVTSLELPFTVRPDNRFSFTFSPKVAFFREQDALYFNTLPIENPGSFGTTFGLAAGVSYLLNPRLLLWGDAFVPVTGNNTINRATGLPARTVAFNAGLRYLLNPRLATDLFVSNTLGNTGALSIVADRAFTSVGLGVTYLPGVTSANRRYPQNFGSTQQPPPQTSSGFALLDGGTIPNQQMLLSLAGGGQGLLAGIQYGLLDDLEIGAFINEIPGTVDESELGVSGKIRFLHQADGAPFTLSGVVTVGRSNNVLINLVNNNRHELEELGLKKSGFVLSNEQQGELLIITFSSPINYQFKGGSAIWLTPTLGFVQRNGLQIAGFNLGGSVPLVRNLDLIAEAGLDLSSKGNAFIGNTRETIIPWSVGLRWYPSSVLGISNKNPIHDLRLEVYATNRVGSTPFESLRVRANNEISIGAGLVLPIQF